MDMKEHLKDMLEEFPVKFNDNKTSGPAGVDVFKEDSTLR